MKRDVLVVALGFFLTLELAAIAFSNYPWPDTASKRVGNSVWSVYAQVTAYYRYPGWYSHSYHRGSSSCFPPVTYDSPLLVVGTFMDVFNYRYTDGNFVEFYLTNSISLGDFAKTASLRRFFDVYAFTAWEARAEAEVHASP